MSTDIRPEDTQPDVAQDNRTLSRRRERSFDASMKQ
jgi:hypothetical protein